MIFPKTSLNSGSSKIFASQVFPSRIRLKTCFLPSMLKYPWQNLRFQSLQSDLVSLSLCFLYTSGMHDLTVIICFGDLNLLFRHMLQLLSKLIEEISVFYKDVQIISGTKMHNKICVPCSFCGKDILKCKIFNFSRSKINAVSIPANPILWFVLSIHIPLFLPVVLLPLAEGT